MANILTAAIQPWASRRAAANGAKRSPGLSGLYANVPIVDLIQQVEQIADMGFWKYELESGSIYWSPGVFAIHDLEPAEQVEIDNALAFYVPNHRPILEAAMRKATEEGVSWDLELDFTSAKGKKKRVRSVGKAEMVGSQIAALVGVFQDVTARYEADRRLREAAMTDDLTGLPNRRHLQQFYSDLRIENSPKRHVQYALALIDLDDFKQANDNLGHLIGDEVLKTTAKRLREEWLSNSFAARLGGDEFVVLIRDSHLLVDLEATGERLLDRLRQPIELAEGPVDVSATIGIAYVEHETHSLSHLLSAADTMLYVAKRKQRGSCILARATDVFLDDTATLDAIEQNAVQVS